MQSRCYRYGSHRRGAFRRPSLAALEERRRYSPGLFFSVRAPEVLAADAELRVSLRALEAGPEVGLELLAHGGHVVGVEQVALDVAVEALAADVVFGALGACDGVGDDLELAALGVAVPDLHEAGVVRQDDLD